jgi:hypothetical protein
MTIQSGKATAPAVRQWPSLNSQEIDMLILSYIVLGAMAIGLVGTLAIYFTVKPWRFLPWKF